MITCFCLTHVGEFRYLSDLQLDVKRYLQCHHRNNSHVFYEVDCTSEDLVFLKLKYPEIKTYNEMMQTPELVYYYASDVIKSRWPEAEPYIMKDLLWAHYYARDIIKGRWPEAEPYIMKDSKVAYMYAKYVIQRSWPEAEPYIQQDINYWINYQDYINDNKWPFTK